MDIYEFNKFCNRKEVDFAFSHLYRYKNISKEDAARITCFVLREHLGIRDSLKVMRAFGLEKGFKDR